MRRQIMLILVCLRKMHPKRQATSVFWVYPLTVFPFDLAKKKKAAAPAEMPNRAASPMRTAFIVEDATA